MSGLIEKNRKPRALTVQNLLDQEFETLPHEGDFYDLQGNPERSGLDIAWGNSTSGKSGFAALWAKEMSNYGNVLFNDLEEGGRMTLQDNFKRHGLGNAPGKILVVKETMAELETRLCKHRSPEFIILNSAQYLRIKSHKFLEWVEKYRHRKRILVISHATGKNPRGTLAEDIKFHADQKYWIEGFKAFCLGRSIGPTGEMTIWDEGAAKYWGSPANNE